MNFVMLRRALLLFLLFASAGSASILGCTQQFVTHSEGPATSAFMEVTRLEGSFKRGVSTKTDVQRLLGSPTGTGNAALPADPELREIWFYQDIEMTDIRLAQVYQVTMREQILLVFFKQEIFDGFVWYSNVAPDSGKSR